MKIERRNLEDFPSKFAVKPRPVLNPLIINQLENRRNFSKIVKIFYHFHTATILYFYAIFGADTVGADTIGADASERRGNFLYRHTSGGCLVTPTLGSVGSYRRGNLKIGGF